MKQIDRKWSMSAVLLALALITLPLAPQEKQDKEDQPAQPAPVQPAQKESKEPVLVPVPAQAVALASADKENIMAGRVKEVSPAEMPFIRWLWLRDGLIDSDELREIAQAAFYALSLIGRQSVPYRADRIAKGRMIRVNLRRLCPNTEQIKEYVTIWERFQFDQKFCKIVTKDTLNLLSFGKIDGDPARKVLVVSRDGLNVIDEDGKAIVQNLKYETMDADAAVKVKDIIAIRQNSDGVDAHMLEDLQLATLSQAPVIDYRYFIFRALSSIEEDGLYKVLYGGLYYDLTGIRVKGDKGTDEDRLFAKLGAGNLKAGVTARQFLDELGSDQRVAMYRSKVSGQKRRVDWFVSSLSRESICLVMETQDLVPKDIDIGQSPIYNLTEFRVTAKELLFLWKDGSMRGALFNGEGKLQEKAPFADRTVPSPHPTDLQSFISCLRCHMIDKDTHGWHALRNDVKTLAKHLDIFGDITDLNKGIPETVDRLAGWYMGSPDKILRLARDDHMAAVLRIAGPWKAKDKKDPGDQTDVVQRTATKIAEIYDRFWYEEITPQKALQELGFDMPPDQALVELNRLLPPDAAFEINKVIPENPTIGSLKAGIAVNRADWDLIYPFAAIRSQRVLMQKKQQQEKKEKRNEKDARLGPGGAGPGGQRLGVLHRGINEQGWLHLPRRRPMAVAA